MNEYFNNTSNPQPNSSGSSSLIRAEFASIKAGFDKLPTIAGNGGEFVRINAGATALETTGDVVASLTVAATGKTTPVDADLVPLVDSEASNVLKKLTWENLKATLKTYFDSLTTTITNKTIALGSNTVSGTLAQFNTAVTDADLVSIAGTETLTNKTLTSPDINGGTIDGTVIGGASAAAGSFTTLSASSYTAASGYYINASAVLTPVYTTQGTQFLTSSVLQWACGSGGYSWNNNANSSSLMSMTNAGAVTIPGGITQESVIAPTLLNSWVNYGGSESTAGYWKDTFGVIHLRGLIKSGATTINTVLFTLPSGYRPIANEYFSISSNELFGNVLINSSGEVLFRSGSATWFSLSGITFKAA